VIDIDVAVRRRRDFALNRHLYLNSVLRQLHDEDGYRGKEETCTKTVA